MRVHRRSLRVLTALGLIAAGMGLSGSPAIAADQRIDLKVLVINDGGGAVHAIERQLETEGVPYREVKLNEAGRPTINTSFLEDVANGIPRAKYQAIVLPNSAPFTNPAEMSAVIAYEKKFGIRQLDAYVYPHVGVGLNTPGYAGELDGTTAALSGTALGAEFRYLRGPVKFEDNSASVPESYGYLATPLPDNPALQTSFQPYLTATAGGQTGTLAGVYRHDGRSEMVLTFAANANQWQFRTIGHGLISWLTKGVHLGHNRNYFAVHVDDVFLTDERWSTEHDCTPGAGCPEEVVTQGVRMVPADVTAAVNWQAQNGLTFDMYYNGFGNQDYVAQHGSDPLYTSLIASKNKFRWANHTWDHLFQGCEQDVSVVPWRCEKDAGGNTVYVTKAEIKSEITQNRSWGQQRSLTGLNSQELVTGEHSGLKVLPQQPSDNPNLGPALNETGVKWIGSDASRDKNQRAVGNALTVPRYPMSVYFNVGTAAEMVDEYNWVYTSRANGGSGICEDNPGSVTCIQPLNTATGFTDYIIGVDSKITLSHVVANDPRPHYAHQSNLAEDRLMYPMLDRILGDYRATFAASAPVITRPMADLGAELKRQAVWKDQMDEVTAYYHAGKVTVFRPSGLFVPITVPDGTRDVTGLLGGLLGGPYGEVYAGERSGYKNGDAVLDLPAGAMG